MRDIEISIARIVLAVPQLQFRAREPETPVFSMGSKLVEGE
jgi:hypothetical protein